MRHQTWILFVVLAVAACGDGVSPPLGGTFELRTINGQPLPWESPLQPGSFITEGNVTVADHAVASRDESLLSWVLIRPGDTVANVASWAHFGSWDQRLNRLIITYSAVQPSRIGPRNPVDTFFVSGDRLLLRETGYIAPLDTMVRVYCRTAAPC